METKYVDKIKVIGKSVSTVTVEKVDKKLRFKEGELFINSRKAVIKVIKNEEKGTAIATIVDKPNSIYVDDVFKVKVLEDLDSLVMQGELVNSMGEIITPHYEDDGKKPDTYTIEEDSTPYIRKYDPTLPILYTGVKIIDFFFPIKKGDITTITGKAGSGKSVILETLMEIAPNLVFSGIGEREREVLMLYNNFKARKTYAKKIFIVAPMGQTTAGAREEAWNLTKRVQTQLAEKGKSSFIVVDNLYRLLQAQAEIQATTGTLIVDGFPIDVNSTMSSITNRFGYKENKKGQRTYSTGIFTNLSSDKPDPGVIAGESIANVNLRLDPSLPYYPKIDILNSKSSNVTEGFISDAHYNLRVEVRILLDKYEKILNKEVPEDEEIVKTAERIYAYFSQNISGGELFTGKPGCFVGLEDRILPEVARILSGALNHIPLDQIEYQEAL